MVTNLSAYSEYKDVGLPWLERTPSSWAVLRAKHVFNCVDVRSKTGEEELLTVSANDGVVPRRQKKVTMFMAESYAGYKLCWPGDLVINSLWAWMKGLGFSRHHGIVSSAYGVYRPLTKYADYWRYFDYLLRSRAYDWELHVRSKGIWTSRLQLVDADFLDMPIVLPPGDEVEKIIKFLDNQDQHIRRLIRAKHRLIALLTEQKQAIIHRAVTQGLDPTAPLKPSGFDWLGDIPMHWEIRRVKSLSLVKRGSSPRPIDDPRYFSEDGEYSWVRIADVTASTRYLESTTQRLSRLGEERSVRMLPGDIFLSIAGSVGKPIITKIKCCIHDGFVYFPRYKGNREFLYYVFASGRLYGGLGKLGTQLNLNTDTVGNITIGWPPAEEQASIVAYLDDALRQVDALVQRAQHEIDLIREYRVRLIADVVTGKLDVRGVTLPPLNEAADLAPLEDLVPEEELEAEALDAEPVMDA